MSRKPAIVRILKDTPEFWDVATARWEKMNSNQIKVIFSYMHQIASGPSLFEIGEHLQVVKDRTN